MMSNSNILTGADKISFVRSQLTPSSLAAQLMTASAFNPKALNYDYDQFRQNFLKAFGTSHTKDSFQWIHDGAEAFTTHFSSLTYLTAQSRSAELATDALESLKTAGWIQNDVLTTENFYRIIEFQYYINFISPQERRIASSLQYTQNESLLDFDTKIGTKLKEIPPPQIVASTTVQLPASTQAAKPSQTPERKSTSYICTYCNKPGHVIERCFQRQRHERQSRSPSAQRYSRYDFNEMSQVLSQQPFSQAAAMPSGYNTNFPSQTTRSYSRTNNQNRRRSLSRPRQYTSQMTLQRPPKHCLIHGPSFHSSEECRKIQNLQQQQTVTVPSAQSNFQQRHFQQHGD